MHWSYVFFVCIYVFLRVLIMLEDIHQKQNLKLLQVHFHNTFNKACIFIHIYHNKFIIMIYSIFNKIIGIIYTNYFNNPIPYFSKFSKSYLSSLWIDINVILFFNLCILTKKFFIFICNGATTDLYLSIYLITYSLSLCL